MLILRSAEHSGKHTPPGVCHDVAEVQKLRHISMATLILAVLFACTAHESSCLHDLQEALVDAAASIGSSGRTGVYVGCMWAHEFLEVLPQLVCFHLQILDTIPAKGLSNSNRRQCNVSAVGNVMTGFSNIAAAAAERTKPLCLEQICQNEYKILWAPSFASMAATSALSACM